MLLGPSTKSFRVIIIARRSDINANRLPYVRPIPLPPAPPTPPIGPQNYPIPNTDLKIAVDQPYGPLLPEGPTLTCLFDAQAEFARQEQAHASTELPSEWLWQSEGIKVWILRLEKIQFQIDEARLFLLGMVQIFNTYLDLETREVNANLWKEGWGIIARVSISRGNVNLAGIETASNGTMTTAQNVSDSAAA